MQPQSYSFQNKVIRRHNDHLVYGHQQVLSQHRNTNVSSHTQGMQKVSNNRNRFDTFKGRAATKSNPPSADTATTAAASMTTSKYLQNS